MKDSKSLVFAEDPQPGALVEETDDRDVPATAHFQSDDDMSDEEGNWQSKAWELFATWATRGCISVETFVHFASELNVDCDASLVSRVMKAEKISNITFKNALRLLEVIPSSMLADDELDGANSDSVAQNVVIVNPFEFVWRMWLCGERDPEKTYSVSSTFKCSPQFWLLFNASFVFLVVAAAITSLMSLFWLQSALDRESTNLQALQETLTFFANSIASASLEVSARDLEDQVVTLSRWLERVWFHQQDTMMAEMKQQLAEDSVMLDVVAHSAVDASHQQIVTFLMKLAASPALAAFSASFLTNTVIDWCRERSYDAHMHDHTSGMTLATTAVNHSRPYFTISSSFEAPCVSAMKHAAHSAGSDGHNNALLSGFMPAAIGLDGEPGSFVAWHVLAGWNISICISAGLYAQQRWGQVRARELVNQFNAMERNATRSIAPREFVLFHKVPTDYRMRPSDTTKSVDEGKKSFKIVTEFSHDNSFCRAVLAGAACAAMEEQLYQCRETKCSGRSIPNATHYTSRTALMIAEYIPSIDAVFAVVSLTDQLLGRFETFLIDGADRLNGEFVETTEIVLAVRNAMDTIVPQVTNFRFTDDCIIPCERIFEGSVPMFDAFRSRASGNSLHPDYTLRPVVGSYSLMMVGRIDVGIMIEQDVPELRGTSLGLIVESLNAINTEIADSTEMMIIQRDGMPTTSTFDADELCPPFVHCITDPVHKVIWREDCIDCVRRPQLNTTVPTYLTSVRFANRCPAASQCVQRGPMPFADASIVQGALNMPDEAIRRIDGNDYSGVDVLAYVSHVRNYSAYIIVKKDSEEIVLPILTSISIYISVAVVCVALGVIGLVFLSRRTLNRIELEWRTYKNSIEAEKVRFDAMIREIVPSSVFQRFQRGQRTVCENHSALSFCYINICNFSDSCKELSPKQIVRSVAYYFTLYNAVAQKFKVFRLKVFGDCGVFTAGLLAGREFASQSAFTMAQFGTYVSQLVSPLFAHFPHRIPQLADAFAAESADEPATMYPVRIGLHSGQAMSGLVDYGKTPFFEIYGASLSLAHRMMVSAGPSRVHASTNFKELLEIADTDGLFEFDAMRKMVVRGSGTVSSYPLRSVHLPVDDVLLHRLKIEYALSMYNFRLHPSSVSGGAKSASHVDSEGSSLIDKQTTSDASGHTGESSSSQNANAAQRSDSPHSHHSLDGF